MDAVRNIEFYQYNETVINPLALFLTILMCIMIILVRREYIIIPLILVACFITNIQRIVILGIDFPMLRILLFIGYIRVLLRYDIRSMKFNKIDKLMIYWTIFRMITHTLLWKTSGAFIHAVGVAIDTMGVYFFIRLAIFDIHDYDNVIKALLAFSVIIAIFMTIEQSTGRNIFSIFGGVPENTPIRFGKLRSQGAFSHAIMAGTFGALLMPLAWCMWLRNYKLYAVIGFITAFIITITSSSSGPMATLATGICGIFLWQLNKHMKKIRRITVFSLIFIHFVMKAPVWHLISRIDLVGGSTGYHRFLLIDNAIRRFSEWFLFGIKSTAHWGWGQQDLTNMYIFEGVYGGILPVILFIMIITSCFKSIGFAKNALKKRPDLQKYVWALGVALFAHVVSFIAVSYFGQMIFFYYLLIAMISCLNNLPSVLNDLNDKDKIQLSVNTI